MSATEPQQERTFYRLLPKLNPKYNYWLVHGSVTRNPVSRSLELERIGPYIPPISFPIGGAVLVSDRVKASLVESNLTGLSFNPVQKKRIVQHAWRVGDPWIIKEYEAQDIPVLATHIAESARYEKIMSQPHVSATAAAIGELWELRAGEASAYERWNAKGQCFLSGIDSKTENFFMPHGSLSIYMSLEAKSWLNNTLGKWLEFELVPERDPSV